MEKINMTLDYDLNGDRIPEVTPEDLLVDVERKIRRAQIIRERWTPKSPICSDHNVPETRNDHEYVEA